MVKGWNSEEEKHNVLTQASRFLMSRLWFSDHVVSNPCREVWACAAPPAFSPWEQRSKVLTRFSKEKLSCQRDTRCAVSHLGEPPKDCKGN